MSTQAQYKNFVEYADTLRFTSLRFITKLDWKSRQEQSVF